jgi:hypothetical protein
MAILLYKTGFHYLAILPIVTGSLIFVVKAGEIIQLDRPKERQIVGKRCLVVKRASREKAGVVRLYSDEGSLDPETWSAELARGDTIEEGITARVTGIRSIILIIDKD